MTAPSILIVDDEPDMRWVLQRAFQEQGYDVVAAADGNEALAALGQRSFDVVLTDLNMPNLGGVELLAQVQRTDPELPVVLLTAIDRIELAVTAMKQGAFDYLQKPFDRERLLVTVARAAEQRRLRLEVARLRSGARGEPVSFGVSERAQQLDRTVDLVARRGLLSILLQGESGTGKEIVAREIHHRSERAGGPFVAVDCGALPEPLMESQLFGHRKGAFTGADQDREGLFRMADRGTLFLDEIGNLPLTLQSKLLRALQERAVVPVGGTAPIPFDARLIAATNAKLGEEIAENRFRADLYHRIAEFVIPIPPLRERREDVLPMARRFLVEACADMGRRIDGIAPAAAALLARHDWPGNLRELRNAVRRAAVVCAGLELEAGDFTLETAGAGSPIAGPDLPLSERLRRAGDSLEAEILQRALAEHGGNKAAAARALQIDYTTLHRKLRRHGLK
jgi:DNA-binding NtrC family response regulator